MRKLDTTNQFYHPTFSRWLQHIPSTVTVNVHLSQFPDWSAVLQVTLVTPKSKMSAELWLQVISGEGSTLSVATGLMTTIDEVFRPVSVEMVMSGHINSGSWGSAREKNHIRFNTVTKFLHTR